MDLCYYGTVLLGKYFSNPFIILIEITSPTSRGIINALDPSYVDLHIGGMMRTAEAWKTDKEEKDNCYVIKAL